MGRAMVVGMVVLCVCGALSAQEPAALEPAPAKAESPWKSEFELGFSASRGTTLSTDLHAAFVTKMKTEEQRVEGDVKYDYGSSSGEDTTNEFTVGGQLDWFYPKTPWFAFGDARYEYNEFESWDHRYSAHAGVGYDLMRRADLDVTLRAGLGAYEAVDDEKEAQYEGLLGGELTYRPIEAQEGGLKSTLYPALNSGRTGEYRWVSSAYWKMKLAQFETMYVKFGVDHEYESDVSGDSLHHDTKIYASVVVGF